LLPALDARIIFACEIVQLFVNNQNGTGNFVLWSNCCRYACLKFKNLCADVSNYRPQRIMHGEVVDGPVLQILAIKKINSTADAERYRILISDGKYFNSYAMLASQLNVMQHNGELEEFTIVQLDKYVTSMVGKDGAGK